MAQRPGKRPAVRRQRGRAHARNALVADVEERAAQLDRLAALQIPLEVAGAMPNEQRRHRRECGRWWSVYLWPSILGSAGRSRPTRLPRSYAAPRPPPAARAREVRSGRQSQRPAPSLQALRRPTSCRRARGARQPADRASQPASFSERAPLAPPERVPDRRPSCGCGGVRRRAAARTRQRDPGKACAGRDAGLLRGARRRAISGDAGARDGHQAAAPVRASLASAAGAAGGVWVPEAHPIGRAVHAEEGRHPVSQAGGRLFFSFSFVAESGRCGKGTPFCHMAVIFSCPW